MLNHVNENELNQHSEQSQVSQWQVANGCLRVSTTRFAPSLDLSSNPEFGFLSLD
jgi:hypothetical protein